MSRTQGKDGKFQSGDRKEHISLRVSAELRDRLKMLPNMSKYVEAVLLEKMSEPAAFPDPNWDYYQEWSEILNLIIVAGNALLVIQQCEERSLVGDDAVQSVSRIFKEADSGSQPFNNV